MCDVVSLTDLRKNEKKQLQRASYVHNANTSITAIIPTIATVLTFILHTSLSLNLNISDVSTAVQNSTTTFASIPILYVTLYVFNRGVLKKRP